MGKKTYTVKFTNPGLIKDGERTRNRHHRKAKSSGGKRCNGNISRVLSSAHYAFHYFFNHGNGLVMNTPQIAKRLGVLYPMIKALFCKETPYGWVLKSEEEFIQELNKTWINPRAKIIDNTPDGGLSTTSSRNLKSN